jgi:hypothetical protein
MKTTPPSPCGMLPELHQLMTRYARLGSLLPIDQTSIDIDDVPADLQMVLAEMVKVRE